MTEFDFDDFIEADEEQPTTAKEITDIFTNAPAFKMGIVGVGQCGNNLATAFHRVGYRRVLLVNTAQTDLDSIEEQIAKLPIDKQGAGKDPAVGKERVLARFYINRQCKQSGTHPISIATFAAFSKLTLA